jgi:ubiquinone/menaquinone biosynthesis C-methylase UbiE
MACCGALHLFPDTIEALSEIAKVMKRGARLAVTTFVKRRFLRLKRIYEHLKEDHGAHIFEVEELGTYLSRAGFKGFDYDIYGSMVLFYAEKG